MPINQPFSFKTLPAGVKALVVASAAAYLAQMFWGPRMVALLGLIPARVLTNGWVWQPFTYLFLHGGIFHLLINLYILWAFGKEIELRWGTGRFLFYFFLCGVGAALFNVVFLPTSPFPSIGASGAIYGLLVAFAVLNPGAVLYLYFFIPMKIWHVIILFSVVEFLASFSGASSGVANLAHLGGLVTGYVYLKGGGLLARLTDVPAAAMDWVKKRARGRAEIKFHEVDQEVDRILEKVLRRGVNSLSRDERVFMDRYSDTKKKTGGRTV